MYKCLITKAAPTFLVVKLWQTFTHREISYNETYRVIEFAACANLQVRLRTASVFKLYAELKINETKEK